ncbi:protein of unknown function [Methylorubrum extorquens DM4]|jgi:hypothetical protein|uniref:Uncharacterized protein n=1 Tax=Methylorubrum extorquens (strain DSM 6343 / CIP 106787 / DM4) TaxID=661410 RepID=C7CEX0_METED|nr:protein of unknown function [Methylorubrum extorquens DM4]
MGFSFFLTCANLQAHAPADPHGYSHIAVVFLYAMAGLIGLSATISAVLAPWRKKQKPN